MRYVSPRADIREGVCPFFRYTGNYLPAYQDREAYVILLPA